VPNHSPENYPILREDAQESELHFFLDLNESEKLSEIKPPLIIL
jgi:hypothetical protein